MQKRCVDSPNDASEDIPVYNEGGVLLTEMKSGTVIDQGVYIWHVVLNIESGKSESFTEKMGVVCFNEACDRLY
ncbi:MAG: hypothetical protein OCC49_01035 [Fibrobacterales bacterium]